MHSIERPTGKERTADDEHVHQARLSVGGYQFLAEALPLARTEYAAGIALLTDLVGAEYELRDGTAWIHPLSDVYDRPAPSFDPAHPTIAGLTRCIRAMAAEVGVRGFVNESAARPPLPWLETFKEIRRRGWCLVFNRWDVGTVANAVRIAEAVGPDGLFMDLPVFDSEDAAQAAMAAIARVG